MLLSNFDIEVIQNGAFNLNGKKLFYCETIDDIRELHHMARAEARAMLVDINKFKVSGVPIHLLAPKGTVEHYVP